MILIETSPAPNGFIEARFPYNEAAKAQFWQMPGCHWNKDKRCYEGPWEAMRAVLSTLEKAGIGKVDGSLDGPAKTSPKLQALPKKLFDYQHEGVSFLCNAIKHYGSGALTFDPGLGKTPVALFAAQKIAPEGKVLIVCPAVVQTHWKQEIKTWLGLDSTILSSKKLAWSTQHAITSYDTFRSIEKKFSDIADVVIPDEFHYLSNSKAGRSKVVRNFLSAIEPRPYIIGLSGTPMMTRIRDLWNPLDLMWPGRWGSWYGFTSRYANGHREHIEFYKDGEKVEKEVYISDGASNLDELRERLKPLTFRKLRSEILGLPTRQRITMPIELPPKALAQLRQACRGLRGREDLKSLLDNAAEYKLKAAEELAKDLIEQGRTVLIYTTRIEHAHVLAKALKCPAVTGEDAPTKRREKLLTGRNCAVATLFSVTTGINLTHFDTVIFVGLSWVPSDLLQGEARLDRPGQTHSMIFYYLIGLRTADESIQSKVIERLGHYESVLGSGSDTKGLKKSLEGDRDLLAEIVGMVKESAEREQADERQMRLL